MLSYMVEKLLFNSFNLILIPLAEARGLAAVADFDFAFVDWNLSGDFAGEVIDILAGRHIPCALVTGYAKLPASERYSDIAVLAKPFVPSDLQRALQRIFESRQAE